MPETDLTPPGPGHQVSLAAAEIQNQKVMQAYSKLLERSMPWLFDVGGWVFGGLIAFTVLVLAALITVGPVDQALRLATVALSLALPLDVCGLVLLRLVQDIKPVAFEEVAQAFQDVGLTPGEQQIPSLTTLQAVRIHGTQITLRYALGILGVCFALTLAGMTLALWHMSWWIAAAFAGMSVISFGIAMVAMQAFQPPVTAAERAQRRRDREELIRQAKERARQAKAQARQAVRSQ
ncbi:MAG TPA: hypothetical protein VGR57_05085 [Ktedonobacterales bacterium]|nr:hypothetical protein [Ktedonobacterales bacterium]